MVKTVGNKTVKVLAANNFIGKTLTRDKTSGIKPEISVYNVEDG